MNYEQIYYNLISKARARASSKIEARAVLDGYSECHHIIPKCIGGTDDISNLVHLSAREHFVSHLLLTKIYPKEYKLLYACFRMLFTNHNEERLRGKTYEELKLKVYLFRKTQNKDNNEGYAISSQKQSGRTKETHEYKARHAFLLTGRTKDNNEGYARISEKTIGVPKPTVSAALAGRTKETHSYIEERAKKVSETLTGRTKETCPGRASAAKAISGRTKETHEYLAIQSERQNILPKDIRNEIVKRRNNNETFVSIHAWVISLGYEIGYTAVTHIYKREKVLQ